MSRTSFADQVSQMWQTRPVRLPRQGPIAGVAAGFGLRYGVDPVLLRVAFVVSTIFGGAGILLYLLAWLVLSSAGNEVSAAQALTSHDQGSSHSQTKTIVLIVALAIAVSTMGPIGLGMGGSGVISMGLMLAGWWMLYLRHPELPAGFDAYRAPLNTTGYPGAGYPGAGYPTGVPVRGYPYNPEVPPTGLYTPYTKLPEIYVPRSPEARVYIQDPNRMFSAESTPLLRVDTTETVVLHKDTDETDSTATESIDTDRSATNLDTSGEQDSTSRLEADADVHASASTAPQTDPGMIVTDPTPDSVLPATDSIQSAPASTRIDLDKRVDSARSVVGDVSVAEIAALVEQPVSNDTAVLHRAGTISAAPEPPRINAQVPNGWDPLAVAPLAWELPEAAPQFAPAAPPHAAPKRPRSRLTPVTIGLAILAAALGGAAASAGVEWMTTARIAALALAVVGLGLVAGAFLRRGYGLLILTAPLAGFVVLASLIGPIEFDSATMGEHTWAPASITELQPRYEVNMGSGTLDLRRLDLTESRSVEVSVNLGEATVLLPDNMTVKTTCEVNMGESQCTEGISGPNVPGAPVLDLRVDVQAGEVVVDRG
ncbi:PspC domain-containing protein [Nocardia sp. NPDC058666]|uniref:PspC domain-containing protein n=1 Tax=Nocardia sp. NPDC058666 TaxID=3346587 RepID=UPI003647B0F5